MRRFALASIVAGAAGCMSGGGQAPVRAGAAPVERGAGPAADGATAGESAAVKQEEAPARGPFDAATVLCERAVRCGTIGRSQLAECREGEGQSRLTLVWGSGELLGLGGLVARGRLAPAPELEQACLKFLSEAPCRFDPARAPAKCTGGAVFAYAPKVPPGGACTRWDECAGGFCTAQPGCEGVCVAYSPAGGACGPNQLCGEGEFCREGRCRPRADVGEECRGHWQWCKDGLVCDGYRAGNDDGHYGYPETPGRCSAGKRLGEGCVPPSTASGEVCEAPLFCDWGADAPVCRAPLAEGAECRWLDACADGLVCRGLVLGGRHPLGTRYGVRTPGRCARVLDAGDACDPAAYVGGCPASMVCDQAKRVCRSTGHAGDPCVSSWVTRPVPADVPLRNEGCFSGHHCDVATRTCKRQLRIGERCTPTAFGVEDEPCFLGKCDAKARRCVARCEK